MPVLNLQLPVLPFREYQKPIVNYFKAGGKRAVWVVHRRAGKDITCWQIMVALALKEVGTYFYCLPEFAHGRRVIWDGMTNDGQRFLDLVPKIVVKNVNNVEMKIELANGSVIRLVGADQYDRLVGTNPKGIVFSEYSLTNPMAWLLLRPILAANGGWAIFQGTPRGKNHMHQILETAKASPSWFYQVLTVSDTKALSEEVLANEKKEMDIDIFNQEYYCSFDAAAKGAYYSEQLIVLREQKRLCKVPYEPALPVYTAFDPGDAVTAIVYFQVHGKEVRVIDADELFSPSVEGIYSLLIRKPYKYGMHFMPFDASVNQMTTGKSIIQQFRDLGLSNIYSGPHGDGLPQQKSKMAGIKLVQSAFSSFWIDETLEMRVIEPLANYAPSYNEDRKAYSAEPAHNWASHMSDAVRYMVIALPIISSVFESEKRAKEARAERQRRMTDLPRWAAKAGIR